MTLMVHIYDYIFNMKRAIILGLLLFGMNAQANTTDPIKESKEKQIEYLKKAKYYEIKAKLEEGKITLEDAQAQWLKNLDKLRKKEGAK